MKPIFLPLAFAFNNLEIIKNELCNLNYAACVDGDSSFGADCQANPELGTDLLCTSDCSDHFERIGGEKYDNYQGFCGLKSNCPPGGCVSSFNIDHIKNYGCWCNFEDNLMDGAADPVNIYDSICRKFQLCLRCAKIDGETEGYGCNPKTVTWSSHGDPFFNTDCSNGNPGDLCGESVCSCNVNFIQRIFAQNWIVPSVYDPVYKHDNGFNQAANCPIVHNGNDVKCCGYWPDRFPYGMNSNKECCDEHKVYNPVSQICCYDGRVVSAGEMC